MLGRQLFTQRRRPRPEQTPLSAFTEGKQRAVQAAAPSSSERPPPSPLPAPQSPRASHRHPLSPRPPDSADPAPPREMGAAEREKNDSRRSLPPPPRPGPARPAGIRAAHRAQADAALCFRRHLLCRSESPGGAESAQLPRFRLAPSSPASGEQGRPLPRGGGAWRPGHAPAGGRGRGKAAAPGRGAVVAEGEGVRLLPKSNVQPNIREWFRSLVALAAILPYFAAYAHQLSMIFDM